MVVLPRLIKDDYNVIVQDGALLSERIGEAYVAGTRKLRAIGGLAVVSGHTQIMVNGRRVEAFRTVGRAVRAEGNWWIARADEVAAWWRVRAQVEIAFAPPLPPPPGETMSPSGQPDVLVRGPTEGGLRDVWIDLVLPRSSESVVPFVDGESVDFAATEWGLRVPVGNLAPGDERRISLLVPDGSADVRPGT
jgi:hypothetical protein